MALIIKAQMPKGCEWTDKASRTGMGYCPLKDRCMAYRKELSKQYTINAHPIDYIPSDCPIIGEIPDKHGRLIDADVIGNWLREQHVFSMPTTCKIDSIIENAPTIIEASTEGEATT